MNRFAHVVSLSTIAVLAGWTSSGDASEVRKNMFGAYLGPTTHHLTSGDAVERLESSTQLDGGFFYCRSLKANLALRVDVRWAQREYSARATTILFPSLYYPVPLSEDFLEFPLMLLATRDVAVGEAVVRISMGGGGYVATLLSQEFAEDPPPMYPDEPKPLDAGGYSRYGWIADGGAALLIDAGTAFFLNFRVQDDVGLTEEPENDVARKDMAFGFYAGFGRLF